MKYLTKILFMMALLAAPAAAQAPPAAAPVEQPPEAAAPAAPVGTAVITIEDAHAFATAPAQKHGAAFMTITNSSSVPGKLVSASASDIADSVEMHNTFIEDGQMMMKKEDSFEIPANRTLKLEASGGHLMLLGLHKPLTVGQVFPLKLVFDNKSELNVDVTVRPPGEAEASPVPVINTETDSVNTHGGMHHE